MFDISNYKIYQFTHIDDFRCLSPIETILDDLANNGSELEKTRELDHILTSLNSTFIDAGWEGDGDINVIYLPPFLYEDGYSNCETIFHVKQSNNGISFLAIPKTVRIKLHAEEIA